MTMTMHRVVAACWQLVVARWPAPGALNPPGETPNVPSPRNPIGTVDWFLPQPSLPPFRRPQHTAFAPALVDEVEELCHSTNFSRSNTVHRPALSFRAIRSTTHIATY